MRIGWAIAVLGSACLAGCAAEGVDDVEDGPLTETVVTFHEDGTSTIDTHELPAADASVADGVASESLIARSGCADAELILYDQTYESGNRLCFRDDGSGADPQWFMLSSACRLLAFSCAPGPRGVPVCSTTCGSTWEGAVASYRSSSRGGYLAMPDIYEPTRFDAGTVEDVAWLPFDRVTLTESRLVGIHHLRNPGNGDQFYTADPNEAWYARSWLGFEDHGIAFRAWSGPFPGAIPMYRHYDTSRGVHAYTTGWYFFSAAAAGLPWVHEGELAYVFPASDDVEGSCRLFHMAPANSGVLTTSTDETRFLRACAGSTTGGEWHANVYSRSPSAGCSATDTSAIDHFAWSGQCPNGTYPTAPAITDTRTAQYRWDRPQGNRWSFYDHLQIPASLDLDELRISPTSGYDDVKALLRDEPCDYPHDYSNAVMFGVDETITRTEIQRAFGTTRGGDLRIRLCVRTDDTAPTAPTVSVRARGRAW